MSIFRALGLSCLCRCCGRTLLSFLFHFTISVSELAGGIPFPSPKIFGMPEGGITKGEIFRALKLETIIEVGAHIPPLHLASC